MTDTISIDIYEEYTKIGSPEIFEEHYYEESMMPENFCLIEYQEKKRIYLDKYPEQEKLREDFFKKVLEERIKSPFYQFENRFMKVN